MNILVIDQCSGAKSYPDEGVVVGREEIDASSLEDLRERDDTISVPARKLYTGRQQQYVAEAVDSLRAQGHTVDRYFVSAGFGLVSEREKLPPYDITFADMDDDEIQTRGDELGVFEDVLQVTTADVYDVIFLVLGSDYYRAVDLDGIVSSIPDETLVVLFNQEDLAAEYDNVASIPARTDEAKTQGTIVIALKGVYLNNFAGHVARGSSPKTVEEIKAACLDDPEKSSQGNLSDF